MYLRGEAGNLSAVKRSIARLLGLAGIVLGVVVSAGCKLESTELDPLTVDTSLPSTTSTTSTSSSATSSSSSSTTSTSTSTSTAPSTTTTTTTTTASGSDALDLSRVATWILPNTPGVSSSELLSAKVSATINSASTNGNSLYTSYEDYSFPSSEGTDAICYFFYLRNGSVVGGKFDWWRTGGQGTKTLENVHDGYGGHSMPSKGTECWTMFSSKDGSQRSNTCLVTWK